MKLKQYLKSDEDLSQYFNCEQCGQCCYNFELEVNPQNLKANGLSVTEVFRKELALDFDKIDKCVIRVSAKCIHLNTATGLCSIHDERPEICRNHFCQRYPKIDEE